jgi:glutathionyl-hydroquinone reductase
MATTQPAYEKAVDEVFEALDKMEIILTGKDYVMGDQLTEADVRLYVTAVRNFHAKHGYSLTADIRPL